MNVAFSVYQEHFQNIFLDAINEELKKIGFLESNLVELGFKQNLDDDEVEYPIESAIYANHTENEIDKILYQSRQLIQFANRIESKNTESDRKVRFEEFEKAKKE